MGGLVGNDPYSCKSHFRQIHNVIMPIYLSRRFQQGISKYFENYREFSLNLYRGVATSSPLHIVLFSEPSSRLRDTRARVSDTYHPPTHAARAPSMCTARYVTVPTAESPLTGSNNGLEAGK